MPTSCSDPANLLQMPVAVAGKIENFALLLDLNDN
jgi:hypothetical protein